MLRFVVTIQLALSLVAGPWLCCCVAARLVGESRAANVAPQKPCPNCQHESIPSQDDSPAVPCKCPCKERAMLANSAPDAGVADSLVAFEPVAVPPAATPAPGMARLELAFPPPRLPTLSTADILFSHHNLRC